MLAIQPGRLGGAEEELGAVRVGAALEWLVLALASLSGVEASFRRVFVELRATYNQNLKPEM